MEAGSFSLFVSSWRSAVPGNCFKITKHMCTLTLTVISTCFCISINALRGEDIVSILHYVNDDVAHRETSSLAKQMPEVRFTLRKKLVLPPQRTWSHHGNTAHLTVQLGMHDYLSELLIMFLKMFPLYFPSFCHHFKSFIFLNLNLALRCCILYCSSFISKNKSQTGNTPGVICVGRFLHVLQ